MRPMILIPAIAVIAIVPAHADFASRAQTIVKPLVSADANSAGQPIVFPDRDAHINAAIFDVPPGAVLPAHKHPFPRLGYVLSGTLRVTNEDAHTSATYKEGEFILESVDTWHRGENVGSTPLKILVIDLTKNGDSNTIMKH